MKNKLKERILKEGRRIVESGKTLRELESEIGVSKSTIHKDMQTKLIYLDRDLYNKVQKVFMEHLESRYYISKENSKKV